VATLTGKQNGDIIRALYKKVASQITLDQFRMGTTDGSPGDIRTVPSSLKAFYKFFTEVGKAFPDYRLQIDNLVEKGNKVMVRYIIKGTHKRGFMGTAPTGREMDIRGIDVFRLEDGKIVYHWNPAYQVNAQMN
jgi:predicted ester cyclase